LEGAAGGGGQEPTRKCGLKFPSVEEKEEIGHHPGKAFKMEEEKRIDSEGKALARTLGLRFQRKEIKMNLGRHSGQTKTFVGGGPPPKKKQKP